MSQIVQMTTEQLEHLIKSLRASSTTEIAGAVAELASRPKVGGSSMCDCPYRYGGERDREIVEEFILSTQTYKDIQAIGDEEALKGLPLLFYDCASTWWQGVRYHIASWQDALESLRNHFAPPRPAYQVYLEFFEEIQDDVTSCDRFLDKKRAILSQLPRGRHNEETELDLLYGLMHLKYRKLIARDDFKTFDELLEKCRIVEYNMREDPKQKKKLCSYCKFHGHTVENCRKLEKDEYDAVR